VVSAAVVASAAALYAARYWLTWDRFIGAHRDEALWLPLAMRANDGALFATDPFVPALERFFPRAWVTLAAAGLGVVGDPGTLALVVSTLLLVVYAVGVSVLSLVVSDNVLVAAVVGIASMRANVDLSGIGWGIFVGNAEPRTFVFAAAPWIIAVFLVSRRTPARLAGLGLAVGLLGNLHPTSALHLGGLLAGTAALRRPATAAVGRAAAVVAGLALGLTPYIVQWTRAYEPGRLPVEIIAFRSAHEIAPTAAELAARLLGSFAVPLALAALALRVPPVDVLRGGRRADLVRLAAVAIAATLLGPIIPLLAPRLFALAPLRLSGYLFLVALVLAGEILRRWLAGSTAHRLAAGALAIALVVTAGGGRLGELARVLHSPPQAATTMWTDVADTAGGVSRDEFLDVCRWARASTRPSDLFLTPTGGWASFRLYAARPLFVAYKDGSMVTFVVPSRADEWYRRLVAVNALYARFDARAVAGFAREHGIRYVVQDRARPAVDLPIAYENRAYRVYDVGTAG
jgi:uncharacterized protein DUF6798